MKAVYSALAFLMIESVAVAAAPRGSWQRAGGNDSNVSYVDIASRQVSNQRVIVMTLSVYAKPISDNIYAVAIKSEYDCPANDFRTLEYSYYDYNGKFMSTEPSETINEHKVPEPGSINEVLMDVACKGTGGTPVADPFKDGWGQLRS